MLSISIPGSNNLKITNLVLDYNGTIAEDGTLLPEAAQRITMLADTLAIHVITADTHGTAAKKILGLPCSLHIIGPDNQDQAKKRFIQQLGTATVAAIGNGRNDSLMLEHAALGIGIIQTEGGGRAMIRSADIVCTHIKDGLDLLLLPDRLRATLRN